MIKMQTCEDNVCKQNICGIALLNENILLLYIMFHFEFRNRHF